MIDAILNMLPYARRWFQPTQEGLDIEDLAYTANHAAEIGDLELLQRLLGDGLNYFSDPEGRTPLMQASLAGHPACVKYLLELGWNPIAADAMGQTALHLAASEGRVAVCRLLITHCDADLLDGYGDKPIAIAARLGFLEIVKLLLPKTGDCRGAFMAAMAEGRAGIAKVLLPRVNPRECFSVRKGGTPLRSCAVQGRADCLALIISSYEESERDELVRALGSARERGHDAAADLIAGRIAQLDLALLNDDLDLHAKLAGVPERAKSKRL